MRVPESVRAALGVEVVECVAEPIAPGTGAASGGLARLTCRTADGRTLSLVRKEFRPLSGGRHAPYANDPGHWAYWRREQLAYASGLLPAGPGLAAPRCFGASGDAVYLADIAGPPPEPDVAARHLAEWQTRTPVPDVSWLSGHQLAQRLEVTSLDWDAVPADPRLRAVWARRGELMAALDAVPMVLSHGDFHAGNLVARDGTTVVLDWATFGVAPVGADLAYLALSTLTDPVPAYLDAGRMDAAGTDAAAVRLGYRVTLALTGASRAHWMVSNGIPVPAGYVEFVLAEGQPLGMG